MEAGEEIRDYILEEKLGHGATGEVWKAKHKQFKRTVAVKIIDENVSANHDLKIRIQREAETMEAVSHPNIVQLLEYFLLSERHPILVMRFIEGGSLQDRIDSSPEGKLDIDQALRISKDILSALDAAHRKGLIHRDVKPANILLDNSGKAYLTDFGIAHVLGKDKLTLAGAMIGTPEYMSPEQIRGDDLTHRTDVYSYGCVLYEMLAGEPPFGSRDKNSTDYEIMRRHDKGEYIPIHEKNPAVEGKIADVISEALEADPLKRLGGCAEMSRRLLAPDSAKKDEVTPMDGMSSPVETARNQTSNKLPRKLLSNVGKSFIVISVIVSVIIGVIYVYRDKPTTKNNTLGGEQEFTGRQRAKAFLKNNPDPDSSNILNVAARWEKQGDCKAADILYQLTAPGSADIAEALAKRFDPDHHNKGGCVPAPDKETAKYWDRLAKNLRNKNR